MTHNSLNSLVDFLTHITDEDGFTTQFEDHKHHFLCEERYSNGLIAVGQAIVARNWIQASANILDWARHLQYSSVIWSMCLGRAKTPEMVAVFLDHIPPHDGQGDQWAWLDSVARSQQRALFEPCLHYAQHNGMQQDKIGTLALNAAYGGRSDNVTVLIDQCDDIHLVQALMIAADNNHYDLVDLLYTTDRALTAKNNGWIDTYISHAQTNDDLCGIKYLQKKIDSDDMRSVLDHHVRMDGLPSKSSKM